MLADVFESFRNVCIEIYELGPAHFLSAPGLAFQACFKISGVELELCHAVHRYEKSNNKDMKNYDKNKELSHIIYLDANNLYRWPISQKLPVNGFKWVSIGI